VSITPVTLCFKPILNNGLPSGSIFHISLRLYTLSAVYILLGREYFLEFLITGLRAFVTGFRSGPLLSSGIQSTVDVMDLLYI
jgi:hypothetical protein